MLTVRKSVLDDLPRLMEIYRQGREIMLSCGNLHQWLPGHPGEEMIRSDIGRGESYAVLDGETVVGAFALIFGSDPTYGTIYGGEWLDDKLPYATIHRLASTKDSKGVAQACFDWAWRQTRSLRVDTHEDNVIMRHCIKKAGFSYCGVIHLLNGDPRLAYQKIRTDSDNMIKSVAVYLGSSGASEEYMGFANRFGKELARRGYRAVFGGAAVGTMKSFADGVLEAGGEIVGVFPKGFKGKREVAARGIRLDMPELTENIEVKDMPERIAVMGSLSDCCVILPGGYGTMEELFFHAVDNEIGLHDKISYVLNINGYYDGLEMQVGRMKQDRFLRQDSNVIVFVHSMDEFFAQIG